MSEPRAKKLKAQLTPKGTLKFPALNTPDVYKGDSKYKTGLVMDPSDPDVQTFITKLEKIRDEHMEVYKQWLIDQGKPGLAKKVFDRPVVKNEEDKAGEDTGMVYIDVAMKSEYKDRKTGEMKQLRPKFFDASGKPIKNPPEIWGGTVARLGVDLMATKRPDGAWGTGFFLDAVFIIDLKGPGAKTADAYGFTAEEGGYTAADTADDDGADYSNDVEDTDADDDDF